MALRAYKTSPLYGYLPPGVKWLIIVNSAIFVPYYLGGRAFQNVVDTLFGLVSDAVIHNLYIWQIFTYLFIHGSILHLLFNMLTLFFFGLQLEQDWGTRKFLKYYFYCGMAAGACVLGANVAVGSWYVATIGSSGAIFGVIVAFGVLYPDQTVLAFLFVPMKAKYMVMIFVGIELLATFGPNTGVSTVAHLGGAAFGYLYLKRRLPSVRLPDFGGEYRRWKMARAKRRFQVYLRKRGGRNPWVN